MRNYLKIRKKMPSNNAAFLVDKLESRIMGSIFMENGFNGQLCIKGKKQKCDYKLEWYVLSSLEVVLNLLLKSNK